MDVKPRAVPYGWIGLVWVLLLVGCASRNQTKSDPNATPDNQLTINNFSLEQADRQGRLVWRLRAQKATYTIDKKTAQVNDLAGELHQDGQLVMRLTAQTASVEQDGERVVLRGDVTASETRNQLVVKGQELEWQASKDLLTIRQNIVATHPQARATADRGEYTSRQQRLEMFDRILATMPAENLKLQASYLRWQVDSKQLTAEKTVVLERFRENQLIEKITAPQVTYGLDRQVADVAGGLQFTSLNPAMQVSANRGTWAVPKQVVNLQNQIRFQSTDPPLDIGANTAQWQIPEQTISASGALKIFHRQENATFQADRGELNLKTNVANLTGNARGLTTQNQANLRANNLTWAIDNQQITGRGGVRYQQTNPQLLLTGELGVGKLQDQTVVVTGTAQRPVETEVIPNASSPDP